MFLVEMKSERITVYNVLGIGLQLGIGLTRLLDRHRLGGVVEPFLAFKPKEVMPLIESGA
ncbi:unnamed protein product [Clonostachys chloroleuca]|uniref:Uncharacterized protein n=1 Tax=Clonostachys chloroleuca TaxID=1926264 RepID=A0AA35VUA0_9HYPO|nr:unnamed protein product [Clonostachys chloroleuca]